MAKTAIDVWAGAVLGEKSGEEIPALLRTEIPPLISWIVRGGCAVQCEHCIFPFEGPKAFSTQTDGGWLLSMLRQLGKPETVGFVHEGRQLLPWQISVLQSVAQAGHSVSVINNGQYATASMLAQCEREGLLIDALDVSVDGTERTHNVQRVSPMAYTWAMQGMEAAHRILKPGGKLTSLYTLTSLNCGDVREVGNSLPLINEWHLTTMSLRSGIEHMRASKRDLAIALEQLLGSRWNKPVYLRTYSLDDFILLLEILGPETARKALENAEAIYNAIVLDIGIPLYFYPKSLQVNETLVVDADMWWRLPFSVAHTLPELQAGVSTKGGDLSHFSVAPVSEELDISSLFPSVADTWWQAIGQGCFNAEREAVRPFLYG